jgi:hypothetical protein
MRTQTAIARRIAALAAVGMFAGCGGGQAAQAVPTPAASSSTVIPAPAPTGQSSGATGGAGLPRCTTAELSGGLGPAEGAAGSTYRDLIFTNTGSRTCELRGFPGVSYVAGDDGLQVGPSAEMTGERGGEVRILPGGTAAATLRLVNVQNYDEAVCRPTPVRGLRVYPPGDTAALFVPMDGTGCAGTPPGPQLSVETMRAS